MVNLAETQQETLKQTATQLLNSEVLTIESIGGGRNSQVYKVTDISRQVYALKLYFQHPSDKRDRLGTEFSSLQFLWDHNIRTVPQPLAINREAGCALYEYIGGHQITAYEITTEEIGAAVEFLKALKELNSQPGSHMLPSASEACFSIKTIVENIQRRLAAFSDRSRTEEPYPQLYAFLDNHLEPKLQEVVQWLKDSLIQSCISFDQELDIAERTLSPSDFGFHNALKTGNGHIIFLDFEYFGWDDPAKMIIDMLLHPAMNLTAHLKQKFVVAVLNNFADYPHLAKRVELVYPLFGLKWCVIILNEFLREQFERRQFAGVRADDRIAVQLSQLDKAKRLLQAIDREYKEFPYFGYYNKT